MSPELIPLNDIVKQVSDLKGALAAQSTGGFPFGVALIADVRVNAVADQLGYSEQYDSTSIAGDPYDAMSHEEIYNKAQSLAPSDIESAANNWRMLGYSAADDTAEFAVRIADVIGTHWQGPAATAAGEGIVRYANAALELVMASHSLGEKVLQSRDGVSDTRANVPAPESFTGFDSAVDILTTRLRGLSFGSMKSRQHARDEAEELARTVMKTLYDPVIRDAAAQIPVLPQALNPLNGGAGFQSPSSNPGWRGTPGDAAAYEFSPPGGGTAGGPSDSGSPADPTAGANPQTSSKEATATETAGFTPTETTGSPQTTSGNPGTSSPTTSTSSAPGAAGGAMAGPGTGSPGGSANRSGSRFGGGTGATGNSGGSGGGGGFGGADGNGAGGGGGGGGRFGGGSGSLGSPSTGGPSQGSGAGAGAGGAPGGNSSSAAGRPGTPGMGGMAPGGGRGGGGGGDDVHNTPGYLIAAINGDELIGTLPLVAPPVLGE